MGPKLAETKFIVVRLFIWIKYIWNNQVLLWIYMRNELQIPQKRSQFSVFLCILVANCHFLYVQDFYTVVSDPIDLSKVMLKFRGGQYSDPFEFQKDVKQLFQDYKSFFTDPKSEVNFWYIICFIGNKFS